MINPKTAFAITIPNKPHFKYRFAMEFAAEHMKTHEIPTERLLKIVNEVPYEDYEKRGQAFFDAYLAWVHEIGVKTYRPDLPAKFQAYVDLKTKDAEYRWEAKVKEVQKYLQETEEWFEDFE